MTEIREAKKTDAEAMIALNERLSRETSFMLLEPEEVSSSIESQTEILQRVSGSEDECLLVAEQNDRLIGFIVANRRPFSRVRHCFSIVVGVEELCWGEGLGRRLMSEIESWAISKGANRLELTVLANNSRAIKLYQSCGFSSEGTRRGSMQVSSRLEDELYMAKIL